jgi:hypothetical protein
MEAEIYSLRALLADIIQTLDGRDNSVKEWIENRLEEIESTTEV